MNSMKSAMAVLSLILGAQVAHAGEKLSGKLANPPGCNGVSVRHVQDSKNSTDSRIPLFLKQFNSTLSDGSTVLTISAPDRMVLIKNQKNEDVWVKRNLYRAKLNSVFVNTLWVSQICISGNSFRMDLEDGTQYKAEMYGKGLKLKGKTLFPK